MAYMKELVEYWLDEYDWRAQEARLNELNHCKTEVEGLGIHFIHAEGKGPEPLPPTPLPSSSPRSSASGCRIIRCSRALASNTIRKSITA